eukprot:TRINITY_DN35596_c0_g1_i2.p1 TRINITY_DN35596_c0_g1~~TRINITY_DN35596_c0_g1_i2.p1  ORF type:complete len:442 (-),score=27.96 TRINITY_DN35596_c0_g1_i2:125-1450(-)
MYLQTLSFYCLVMFAPPIVTAGAGTGHGPRTTALVRPEPLRPYGRAWVEKLKGAAMLLDPSHSRSSASTASISRGANRDRSNGAGFAFGGAAVFVVAVHCRARGHRHVSGQRCGRIAREVGMPVESNRAGPPREKLRSRLRPGKVTPPNTVPLGIVAPPYIDGTAMVDPASGLYMHQFMDVIEIKQPEQINAMRDAGALAREALEVAGRAAVPGATTAGVDAATHDFIVARGAYPSPLGYLGFPKSVCTSVNDVIAHGIPDDRTLEDGDILNIDVTVYTGGHHGDTSSMFLVGRPDDKALRLCRAAYNATHDAIKLCEPGADFRQIGNRIQNVADAAGCLICPLFCGHGIGSYFHGAPEVVPWTNDHFVGLMRPGMVFTIEPILIEDQDDSYEQWSDNWTVQSLTGARSAQFEHTVLITETGHEILTGPSIDYVALATQGR